MDGLDQVKDVLFIVGMMVTIVGSYFVVKYQGVLNSREIQHVKDSNDEQWNKIDSSYVEINKIKERIITAITMETAEKKFVTKEMFDLTTKQFDLDLKQTKGIAQNTLDAVQTLNNSISNIKKET